MTLSKDPFSHWKVQLPVPAAVGPTVFLASPHPPQLKSVNISVHTCVRGVQQQPHPVPAVPSVGDVPSRVGMGAVGAGDLGRAGPSGPRFPHPANRDNRATSPGCCLPFSSSIGPPSPFPKSSFHVCHGPAATAASPGSSVPGQLLEINQVSALALTVTVSLWFLRVTVKGAVYPKNELRM